MKTNAVMVRVHTDQLRSGIRRSPEFAHKGLATHAVNVGLKCGHDCRYCSTGAVLRMHQAFRRCGESPFGLGYAIVDPTIPERVARDARRMKDRGLIQLCTLVDAWAPEAQRHNLGRRCLEAILAEPGWTVRILTKNAAVTQDFDLVGRYRDRVLVGLSLTATPDQADVMAVVEPHASTNPERMAALREAHKLGLRTYGMLCPLLPGIADGPDQIDELVRFVVDCGAEEIFAEAVNPRGRGLILTEEALAGCGYGQEADAVGRIRHTREWSLYAADLIANLHRSVRRHFDIRRLHILLYPSGLRSEDEARIRRDDAGVVWL